MTDYATDQEKLLAIQDIVGEMFTFVTDPRALNCLMHIDSICDVPLEGEF